MKASPSSLTTSRYHFESSKLERLWQGVWGVSPHRERVASPERSILGRGDQRAAVGSSTIPAWSYSGGFFFFFFFFLGLSPSSLAGASFSAETFTVFTPSAWVSSALASSLGWKRVIPVRSVQPYSPLLPGS